MKGIRLLEEQTDGYTITLEHVHGALDFHLVSVKRRNASVTFWWGREPTETELKQLLDFIHSNYADIDSMMNKRSCTYVFLDIPTQRHFRSGPNGIVGLAQRPRLKWGL